MNILFVSLLLPHPRADHASAFTVFETIKRLSQRHRVSLISFVRSEAERACAETLAPYCRRVKTVLLPQRFSDKLWTRASPLLLKPMAVASGDCREMRACIRSACRDERFDIVQMEYAPMAQYAPDARPSPVIVNVHDVIHVMASRLAGVLPFSRAKFEWLIDSLVAGRHEAKLYRQCDHILALSDNIRDHILALDPSLGVTVVRPGVEMPPAGKTHAPGRASNLVFMGAMWRNENVESVLYFYHSVFGRIRAAVPDVRLYIVGGNPQARITALASDPAVHVTGYVEDLLAWYLKCDVSVAPMRVAGGVLCKILDAMAAGLPVVTTSQGNEGVAAQADEEIVIADNPADFASRTVELLENGPLRNRIGRNAAAFVRRRFSWDESICRLENAYEACLQSREGSTADL